MSGFAWVRRVLAAFLGVLITGTVQGADVPVFSDISYRWTGDSLEIRLSVTPEPVFTAFTLRDPDRLVVDFPAFDWQVPTEGGEKTPYIADIRHGLFRHDRARLVFSLTEPVALRQAYTRPAAGGRPPKLIFDLIPVDRETFDAMAGAPEQARWHDPRPTAVQREPGDIVVAIDPGHGGIDPGAIAAEITEKTVVLDFSRRLAAALKVRPGFSPVLIREQDVFVPLAERVARAHRAGAHVFLSVHADTLAAGQASGVSFYTLSEHGTDQAADALAARENRTDLLAGADLVGESDDLTRVLIELAQRGTADESEKLARALVRELDGHVELLRSRPIRRGNFRVLKAPDIPSVLLELGFLDSDADLVRLSDPAWLDKTAELIADGVGQWRKIASPGFLRQR